VNKLTIDPPPTKLPKSNLKFVLEVSIGLIFSLVVLLLVLEHIAYEDITTCRSDHLFAVQQRVITYIKLNRGQLGEDPSKISSFVARNLPSPKLLQCQKNQKPFLWFPKEQKSFQKIKIIAMCPNHSHGWLRKFSWAIGYREGHLGWYRIGKNEKVSEHRMN